ncbi:MAG: class I tRNA ligase family protein [Candidatus Vogelbacteria bacterium]|nr:class I tRNA ligase family protein [Candidatus Vogelbacteria bacterium]
MQEKPLNAPDKPESVNEREERTLKFWQDNKIFEKSLAKDSPAGEFVFYDGPPFATGLPHYGHILPMTIKDVIPRYKTMKGYYVARKWGWDCHGLPIENLIEGELGLKTKGDIESLGVAKFNSAAKDSVLRYEKDWKRIIPRLGRFVDMDNPYKTMDWTYTETIWWIFKTLFDKDLIYEGYKAMHLCPRCETTLANFEVNQGYKDITDISLTAKFELVDEPGTFVLAWTTTPWTLPGNVALAVNPEVEYMQVHVKKVVGTHSTIKEGETYIFAATDNADKKVLGGDAVHPEGNDSVATITLPGVVIELDEIRGFKGKDLIGKKYKPLFDYYSSDTTLKNHENGWKIYGADFVTTTDGTGVVHIAPAFGEDDMNLGVKDKLPFIQHVGTNGQMRPEVKDFAGLFVKPKDNKETGTDHQSTDIEVIKNLAHRGLLFAKEKITHSYPHCWRCDTPLLNYAASSWFVKVTEFKNKLLANNQKTLWIPGNIRDGRFGNWLEGARDWAISRARYWGAPLPVWRCEGCKKIKVLGSIEDIKKEVKSNNQYFIMRHGEAESNVAGKITCDPDGNDLTLVGRKQVEESAKLLKDSKITLIISSDYTRTKETTQIVVHEIGYDTSKVIYDARLHEVNFGAYNNESIESYHSHFKTQLERFNIRPEGGENLIDVRNRVASLLYELEEKYKGQNILIVSHGDPTWLMQAVARSVSPQGIIKDLLKDYRELYYLKNAEVRRLNFSPLPHNENYELDLHKPFIDDVKLSCECGAKYKRINEVFDCWFESGSMPYAQIHYPFENKEWFEKNFPANFIAEGLDQTRGWFYSLMVLSTALFDEPAFNNVVVNGMILAEDGQKMSKRLKNYPDLMYVVEKYGADALRYYLVSSQAVRADDLRFSERGVDEIYKKVILRIQNVLSFYKLYADESCITKGERSKNVLDIWIMARLSSLAEEVEKRLKDYELDRASRPIFDFLDDLSTWYLRRSRERLKSDDVGEKAAALTTLCWVLEEFSKVIAPFMPFIAEEIYRSIGGKEESVHLESWPFFGELLDDETENKKRIFEEMQSVRDIVSAALDERKTLAIPVRQPLAGLKIKSIELQDRQDLLALIKDEVNVKEVVFDDKIGKEVELDVDITPELKEEGNLRELTRALQDMRKKINLLPSQKVELTIYGSDIEQKFLEKFAEDIRKAVNLSHIKFEAGMGEEIKVGGMIFTAWIVKKL